MNGIKGTLAVILIIMMMLRGIRCPDVTITDSCFSLNMGYSLELTNESSPLYIKTKQELESKIRDAGYDSTHYIEFYESYGGTVLAYVKIRVTKIGEEDSMEEDLKKATLNVLSVNNSCDCEVCKKWSGWYPCPQVDHPGGESRCSLNLCIPRKCRPEMKVNSTGNSITKKADDCPTRPMTNITNRDQKDMNSNTHGADNSWTTPKTNTSNTDQNCPGPKDDCYPEEIIIISNCITFFVTGIIALFVFWCHAKNKKGKEKPERKHNTYTAVEIGTNPMLYQEEEYLLSWYRNRLLNGSFFEFLVVTLPYLYTLLTRK